MQFDDFTRLLILKGLFFLSGIILVDWHFGGKSSGWLDITLLKFCQTSAPWLKYQRTLTCVLSLLSISIKMPCNALTSAQFEVDLYCERERRSSQELGGGNIVLRCYTGRQLHTSEPLRHVEWWYMGLAEHGLLTDGHATVYMDIYRRQGEADPQSNREGQR